jgi:predicted RNA binding protein with dsRBD fold (UPF0201 family)
MKKKDLREYLKHDREIKKVLSSARMTVRAPIYECEDPEKVAIAMKNIVNLNPTIMEEEGLRYMFIEAYGYEYTYRIFNHFRNRQVLATLRKYLMKYLDRDKRTITFYLHKQAAYSGVLSLAEPGESPLGEIVVHIETDKADEIIRWLTRF